MGYTLWEAVSRYFGNEFNISDTKPNYRIGATNIFADHGKLYSYGYHFCLAEIIRVRNKPYAILLNGDNYSVSTTRHQGVVRGHAQFISNKFNVPVVIIPFQALDAAQIDRQSIRLLEVTDDRFDVTYHKVVGDPPVGMRTEKSVQRGEWEWIPASETGTGYGQNKWVEYEVPVVHIYYSLNRTNVRRSVVDGVVTWEWEEHRHWLGESLISATYSYAIAPRTMKDGRLVPWESKKRKATFLSGFDMQENPPSYFFAQLPTSAKPKTVAEAYEALKPESVKAAEMLGNSVKRQGDMFAIELPNITTKMLKARGGTKIQRMEYLLGTNHVATDVITLPDNTTFARGNMWHRPSRRRPDHRRVPLGKCWHVVAKNTVPISGGR